MIIYIPIKEKSQRVPGKNFRLLDGVPLYKRCLNKFKNYEVFVDTDSIQVISEIQKDPNFKGNIVIEIASNNDYITFRIHDNGPGITDAKKAMTPYFTTKKTGTGLGLPIVTKIINEHNGIFSIKKNKDNKGTIVTVSLPKYV